MKNASGVNVNIITGCKWYTISTGFDKPIVIIKNNNIINIIIYCYLILVFVLLVEL